jgi:hypothetical protein
MANPRIDGIYELGHVLYALDNDAHGLTREQIARVESYWTFSDMHSSAAGFVVLLHDGRRTYVDFLHWHGFEQEEDFRIEVELLSDGRALPALSSSPPGDWSSDTAHLNRMLNG